MTDYFDLPSGVSNSNVAAATISNTTSMNSPADVNVAQFKSPIFTTVPIPTQLNSTASELSEYYNHTSMENNPTLTSQNVDYPTIVLSARFHKWKKILKFLIVYLKEVALAQQQFARINSQVKSAVKFNFLTDLQDISNNIIDPKKPSGFMDFGSGSIQDLQVILKKYHSSLSSQQIKISKEILSVLIPKLETLKKDLSLKIKDIKSLHNDFKSNLDNHIKITNTLLNKYSSSVRYMMKNHNNTNNTTMTNALSNQSTSYNVSKNKNFSFKPKHDPYLLKLQVDLQLKRQLAEENYLQDAFVNIQSSGLQLEKIIYSKIQNVLTRYSTLIDSEARLMIKNLTTELHHGICSKPPAVEWDHFINNHQNCLMNWKSNDPIPRKRTINDIVYPEMKSRLSKCIRAGYLCETSFLSPNNLINNKNEKNFFVLTTNYLHKFENKNFFNHNNNSNSRNLTPHNNNKTSIIPLVSLSLNDSKLLEFNDTSFVLVGKPIINLDNSLTATTSNNQVSINSGTSHHNSISSSVINSHSFSNIQNANNPALTTKKSGLNKFLKGKPPKPLAPLTSAVNPIHHASSSISLKSSKGHSRSASDISQFNSSKQNELDLQVKWKFVLPPKSTDEDRKIFKKWIQDLKSLTTFDKTTDRLSFIEEKYVKQRPTAHHHHHHHHLQQQKSFISNTSTLNTTNKSTLALVSRPTFIDIEPVSSLETPSVEFRSKINTPAIDDKGNLITMTGRFTTTQLDQLTPSTIGLSSGVISGYNSGVSSAINSGANSAVQSGANSPRIIAMQALTKVTSSPNLSQVEFSQHAESNAMSNLQRPSSNTIPHPTVLSPNPMITPKPSTSAEPSAMDYFAIPIGHSETAPTKSLQQALAKVSNESTPLFQDASNVIPTATQSLPISRATTRSGNSAATTPGLQVNGIEKVPSNPIPSLSRSSSDKTGLPTLANSHPSSPEALSTHNSFNSQASDGDTSFSKKNNPTLTPSAARTQVPVRRHKKNVSFGSLNSLIFAKKAAASYGGGDLLNAGIEETEDDHQHNEDPKPQTSIQLTSSIYKR